MTGALGGSTLVVMAMAIVIGEVACVVTVAGAVDETSTIRAVLLGLASGGGSAFDGGFKPWSSSFWSSRVCIRPFMTVRVCVISALSAVRILKFRYVWYS